jgi:hypothetical protein
MPEKRFILNLLLPPTAPSVRNVRWSVGGCKGLHQEASEPTNWLQSIILQGVGATGQIDKLTIGSHAREKVHSEPFATPLRHHQTKMSDGL